MAIAMRHVVKFPANVVATRGVDVARANGRYTFKLDYQNLVPAASVGANVNVAFQDPISGEMGVTTLSSALNSNANIQAIANSVTTFDKIGYWNGTASYVLTDFTAFGRTLVGATSDSAARASLGIVNPDWNAISGLGEILNKPSLATVATSGSYSDLADKPSIPAAGIPAGGTTGQVLSKTSGSDYAATWGDAGAGDMIKASNLAGLPNISAARSNIGLGDSALSQYDTKSQLHSATVPVAAAFVRTVSNNLTSKLGAAIYKKVDTEPAHNLKEQSADGLWWDLSVPRVDATMAGMIGDNSYDNGQAIEDVFGYAGLFGAEVYLPTGVYKISAGNSISSPSKPPSMIGDGNNSSVIQCAGGDYTALMFDNCQSVHLRGFRIQKRDADEDTLGTGLWVSQTSYFDIKDVCCWGWSVGLRLVNSLSGLIERPLLLYNEYGMYGDVDTGLPSVSRLNALTILSPTIGLNNRRGVWMREPGTLNIIGGSIEGNGGGQSSDHGGVYILNAGTESGVGLNLEGVQMERNRGEADVYIAGLINAGTVYNINKCSIFPIDGTDFTTHRIYFENGVQQNLNLSGNSFKHYGSYTPSSSRKVISAATPSLLSVNLGGDIKQFYSTTEFPTGLGAMGMSYGARVASDGSAVKMRSDWSSSKTGTGQYAVTLPAYLDAGDFAWSASAATGSALLVQRIFVSTGEVDVVTTDISGTLADAAFSLTATPIS